MLEALQNPGALTGDQWMIVGILVLVFIGILYFLYRTWMVIQESANNKYKPNIGMSRIREEQARHRVGRVSDVAGRHDDKQDD